MDGYRIESANGRVLIYGSIPVLELAALQKLWKKQGIDSLALGVASSLGATLAACRKGDIETWNKEVSGRAAEQANGDAELEWLLGTDTGRSSMTIFSVLAANETARRQCLVKLGHGSVPHDPDDFGRCHRLLEKFPAWRARLGEVAAEWPKWSPLVAEWDNMTALYLEELPTGYCPKLYALMKTLR